MTSDTSDIWLNLEGSHYEKIKLDQHAIASGADGSIYAIKGHPELVAKIYHDTASYSARFEKIKAMLKATPNIPTLDIKGIQYVQLTWPVGWLENSEHPFIGYVMPVVDLARATALENILSKKTRQAFNIHESYHYRLTAAYNLAAIVAELHTIGHYVIDLKPININVYIDTHTLCILDCDGFSISGEDQHYPAHQYSDGYICPEALQKKLYPEDLGESQDKFALAVTIFQLMNQGLHPFQGIPAKGLNVPSTNSERIRKELFAYGSQKNKLLHPSPWSIHNYFDSTTQRLFERAFTTHHQRPTAKEWMDHLANYLTPEKGKLIQCKKEKEHLHFSKGCGFCKLIETEKNAKKASTTPRPQRRTRPPRTTPRYQPIPATPTGPSMLARFNQLPVLTRTVIIALIFIIPVIYFSYKDYLGKYDLDTIIENNNVQRFETYAMRKGSDLSRIDYTLASKVLTDGRTDLYCSVLKHAKITSLNKQGFGRVIDGGSRSDALQCFLKYVDYESLDKASKRSIEKTVNSTITLTYSKMEPFGRNGPVIRHVYNSPSYRIIAAAKKEDLKYIKTLVKLGAKYSVRDRRGRTIYNVSKNKLFVMKLRVLFEKWTPLQVSVGSDDVEMFLKLFAASKNKVVSEKLFNTAIREKSLKILKLMFLNKYYPFGKKGRKFFSKILSTEDRTLIMSLLQRGFNLNKKIKGGKPPIKTNHQATIAYYYVKYFLDANGLDLRQEKARQKLNTALRTRGMPYLRLMAAIVREAYKFNKKKPMSLGEFFIRSTYNKSVKVLLDGSMHGWTIFQIAAAKGGVSILRKLVSNKHSRLLITDSLRRNLLHIAVLYKQEKMVLELVKNRRLINAEDKKGYTPLMVASYYGFQNIVRILLANNAKQSTRAKPKCSMALKITLERLAKLKKVEKFFVGNRYQRPRYGYYRRQQPAKVFSLSGYKNTAILLEWYGKKINLRACR